MNYAKVSKYFCLNHFDVNLSDCNSIKDQLKLKEEKQFGNNFTAVQSVFYTLIREIVFLNSDGTG